MGSRSFFHIGDVIQIVSGTKYAILDPDGRVSCPNQALLDVTTETFDTFEGKKTFFQAYPDECAPFRGMFDCTMESHFDGTIIHVP